MSVGKEFWDKRDLKALRVEVMGMDSSLPRGAGAFGVVFDVTVDGKKCIAKKLHRVLLHAVKHYSSGQDDSIVKNFQRECLTLSKLNHPNVVGFVGVHFGQDETDISLIMERLHCDLADFVKKNPNTCLHNRLKVLSDVSEGLHYLHTQNPPLIHRDLTAPNILLTEDLDAKIGDLGVSRYLDPTSVSSLTTAPGNLHYMAPECRTANPIYSTKMDIFCFGNLILHAIIGEVPEVHETPSHDPKLIQYIKAQEVEVMRRTKAIHERLGQTHCVYPLVVQCLHDKPEERPSVQEVKNSLQWLCLGQVEGGATEDRQYIVTDEQRLSAETPVQFQLDPLVKGLESEREMLLAYYSTWSEDRKDHSSNIYVKENKVTIYRLPVAKSSDLARGKRGFSHGLHHWNVIWHGPKMGSNAVVGVCTELASVQCDGYHPLLGLNDQSWGWDLSTRLLIHNGLNRGKYPLTSDTAVLLGECIGVTLNMIERTLSFDLKGKELGIAFRNLPKAKLYPAISAVYAKTEVSLLYRLPSKHIVQHKLYTETPEEFRSDPLVRDLNTGDMLKVYESTWSEDPRDHSHNISIKPNKLTIHRRIANRSSDMARGKKGFSSGVHYWTVIWHGPELGTSAVVGVCTKQAEVQCDGYYPLLGGNKESWGWDLSKSILRHDGWEIARYPDDTKVLVLGQSIGVTLNMTDGTVSFDLNGKDLGIAFKDIPNKKLYPAISAVYGNTEVSLVYRQQKI